MVKASGDQDNLNNLIKSYIKTKDTLDANVAAELELKFVK